MKTGLVLLFSVLLFACSNVSNKSDKEFQIPPYHYTPPKVEDVEVLGINGIKDLEKLNNIKNYTNLKRLEIMYPGDIVIPEGLKSLEYLEEVSIIYSNVTGWENLSELPITSLILKKVNINEIPICIKTMNKLELLYIGGSNITEIPDWLYSMHSIRGLVLSNLNIMKISNKISQMPNLGLLDLSDNKLNEFPEKLYISTSIYNLNLSNNSIESIPYDINKMNNLDKLNLSGNKLKTIDFYNINIKKISIDNNQIEKIDGIGKMQQLKELYASGNKISNLSVLSKLTKLERIEISNNMIRTLPRDFSSLTSLYYLDLSNNPLGKIPRVLTSLNSLKVLKLESCNISAIAIDINEFPYNTTLFLKGNEISEKDIIKNRKNDKSIELRF